MSQSISLEPHPLSSGGDLIILIRGLWNTLTICIWGGKKAHIHQADAFIEDKLFLCQNLVMCLGTAESQGVVSETASKNGSFVFGHHLVLSVRVPRQET